MTTCTYAILFWQIATASKSQFINHIEEIREKLKPGEYAEISDISAERLGGLRSLINQVSGVAAHVERDGENIKIQVVRYK